VKRLIASLAVTLACCSGVRQFHLQEAKVLAASAGLVPFSLQVGGMTLLGFERSGPRHSILSVYIEGDGRAWTNPWQPSTDPTPSDPIGLRLAAADPARPLLYLARPCQFVVSAGCDRRLWTSARFSSQVVEMYQRLIDDALWRTNSNRIGLVGYSGGGALAALIAERRHDVAWLVTVAADLDLAEWSRRESVEPLSNSLDPAADADAIEGLPQMHLVGVNDRIVPPEVVRSFVRRLPANTPARTIVVPGFDHSCCWAEAWPRLLGLLDIRR
jgi:pimeloyl-ACP methyl ester carboxylesterase